MRHATPSWILASVLLLLVTWAPQVRADTTCTAVASQVAFGNISNMAAAATPASMGVQITCSTSGLTLLANVRVRLCVGIGSGSASSAILPARQLVNTSGDSLAFQLYTDAAHQTTWGLLPGGTPPAQDLQLSYAAPLLGGSGSITTTVYGLVPANQSLATGTYSSSFNTANVTLSYAYNEVLLGTPTMPTSCTAAAATNRKTASNSFPFTATATVLPQCGSYLVSDMDFGNATGRIATPINQTAQLTLTCVRRTPFNVALDNGENASGSTRRMRNASSSTALIPYELYRDAARTLRWGNTVGSDTVPGTGTGTAQQITIYGRAPATSGALPVAGSYSDRVTVTITY